MRRDAQSNLQGVATVVVSSRDAIPAYDEVCGRVNVGVFDDASCRRFTGPAEGNR